MAKKNKIDYTRNSKNLGYEKTLIRGMKIILKKNKYKSILTMDADGQHTIESLKKFTYKKIGLYDVIVGKRNNTNRYIEDIISKYFFKRTKYKTRYVALNYINVKFLKKLNLT